MPGSFDPVGAALAACIMRRAGAGLLFPIGALSMRRVFALCAAMSLVLAVTAPAQAAPFHLIKWSGNDLCQIWDDGVPTKPFPANFKSVSKPVPTFEAANAIKTALMKKG